VGPRGPAGAAGPAAGADGPQRVRAPVRAPTPARICTSTPWTRPAAR
jgi:hypothetical protein